MNPLPFFSIIVPTYNSEQFIYSCIESVLNQSYKNFEILVMDAVSSDKTLATISQIKDPRIKVHSEKDKGIYDGMNRGILQAKGKWIYFLGSDDELFNTDVLRKVSEVVEKKLYDVVYGQVLLKQSNKLHLGEFNNDMFILYNISHQAIFTKRELFDRLGLFDLKYRICADHIFNVKWFFDSKIKKQYIDLVIAKFSQKGLSSLEDDPQKIIDLPKMVLRYGGMLEYLRFYVLRQKLLVLNKILDPLKNLIMVLFKRLFNASLITLLIF